MELFRQFGMRSGRKIDKFADIPGFERTENEILYPKLHATMCLSAEVTEQVDLGDHTLFIGRITQDLPLSDAPTCSFDYFSKNIAKRGVSYAGI